MEIKFGKRTLRLDEVIQIFSKKYLNITQINNNYFFKKYGIKSVPT